MSKFRALIAGFVLCAVSSPAIAIEVTSINITNALPDYLQVAEVVATQAGTGTDVALAGSASAFSNYSTTTGVYDTSPAKAIDGITGGSYYTDGIYHSAGDGSNEYLRILFDRAYDISKLTIFGRTDCCTSRDVYNYALFNGSNMVGSGTLDASTTNPVSASFAISTVPEPTSWIMMILGMGAIGFVMRRQKVATRASYAA